MKNRGQTSVSIRRTIGTGLQGSSSVCFTRRQIADG